ncbi:MAG: hypothetical protein Q8L39_06375, partial [Burkholderiales bacterium]|nr:hypothetical protein [Burkholderiales bacterium]
QTTTSNGSGSSDSDGTITAYIGKHISSAAVTYSPTPRDLSERIDSSLNPLTLVLRYSHISGIK